MTEIMNSSILMFLIFVVVAVVNAKAKFDKIQKSPSPSTTSISSDEMFRLYQKAKKEVDELNKKYPSATFEINKFSFMTETERKKYHSKLPEHPKSPQFITFDNDDENITAPDSYDYREDGFVTPVKDQKHCGSCYAFAATAAVESQYLVQNGDPLDLSEEYVLECDSADYECEGGQPADALDVYKTKGVPSESCVPYNATNGTCPTNLECDMYFVDGYKFFGNDEDKYPGLLYKYGPAAFSFVEGDAFQNYESGVLDIPLDECGTGKYAGWHAVLLVGYTEDYWIAKNSWGEDFGENGYFRFKRGVNFCNFTVDSPVVPYLSKATTTTTVLP